MQVMIGKSDGLVYSYRQADFRLIHFKHSTNVPILYVQVYERSDIR